jgi:hypothetical protein
MDWATLFERAPEGVTVADVRETLEARREGERSEPSGGASGSERSERHASREAEDG